MLKKYFSILMIFIAVAIMLGHNIIGHHHHHKSEHSEISHHSHSNNDHHHNDNAAEDAAEDECEDWEHLFSGLLHGADGIVCLTSNIASNNIVKLIPQFNALNGSYIAFQQVIIDVRQNAPPFLSAYYSCQNHLPYGLRAPPVFIV